ncbi:hypothetical protein HanPSC8_Chr16g0705931 [Helianthus annuus]|nr:hypothetical protein HanPSC8_Chr16g0705931 [Helianthus annuus]
MPVIISSKLTEEEKSRLIERSSGECKSRSEANFREDGREE